MGIQLNPRTDLTQFREFPDSTRVSVDPTERTKLDEVIKQIFKVQLEIRDNFAFNCLWKQALSNREICWKKGQNLDLGTLRTIEAALQESKVFHGDGIPVSTDPENENGEENTLHPLTDYFLGRNEITGGEAFSIFAQAIKGSENNICRLFTQELKELFLRLGRGDLPSPETPRGKLLQMFIGHLISAIPFVYPNPNEDRFSIPMVINGQWEICEYHLERIELMAGPFSPLLAFGLTVPDRADAPPILTLSGTTWGEGRFVGILADLTPFTSMGYIPYFNARLKLKAWMDLQNKPINLYGTSLGGALCFNILNHFAPQVGSANIYNSPGLYRWKGPVDGPEVNIFMQENDLASKAGWFPKGNNVNVYRVVGEKLDGIRESHGRSYGGSRTVTIIKSCYGYENSLWSRTAWTAMLFISGIIAGTVLWTFYFLAYFFHIMKQNICALIHRCKPVRQQVRAVNV